MKPLLLIDIDGVLNPFYGPVPPGYSQTEIGGYRLRLNPNHAQWLKELEDNFEMVWASSWGAEANLIGKWIGLPELKAVPMVAPDQVEPETTWKLSFIDSYVIDRPFAWLDDDLHEDAYLWAKKRRAPSLLLKVDPYLGLQREEVEGLKSWVVNLAGDSASSL